MNFMHSKEQREFRHPTVEGLLTNWIMARLGTVYHPESGYVLKGFFLCAKVHFSAAHIGTPFVYAVSPISRQSPKTFSSFSRAELGPETSLC